MKNFLIEVNPFKGEVTEVDVTQTYCDQNTAKISIVHTINN